jgi:hypothetical protein
LVPFGQVVSEEKIKPEAHKSLYRSPPFKMAAVFKGNDYLPLKFASVSFYCQVSDTGSVG